MVVVGSEQLISKRRDCGGLYYPSHAIAQKTVIVFCSFNNTSQILQIVHSHRKIYIPLHSIIFVFVSWVFRRAADIQICPLCCTHLSHICHTDSSIRQAGHVRPVRLCSHVGDTFWLIPEEELESRHFSSPCVHSWWVLFLQLDCLSFLTPKLTCIVLSMCSIVLVTFFP